MNKAINDIVLMALAIVLLAPVLALFFAFPLSVLAACGLAIAPTVPFFLGAIAAPFVAREFLGLL